MKLKILLLILSLLGQSSLLAAEKKLVYDWLTMGKKLGQQIVTYKDSGEVEIDFYYEDRGRGPKMRESVWFDGNGIVVKQKITGRSYMGAPIDEHFSLINDRAQWKSTLEKDIRQLKSTAYYVAANGTPMDISFLALALNKAPNKKLALLPSGEASFETLKSIDIKNGKRSKNISLIAIHGLDFSPNYAWLDQDLNLFALTYGWSSLILSGWEQHEEQLQSIQDDVSKEFYKALARTHQHFLDGSTLITNVHVLNQQSDKLIYNSNILIEDGIIVAVGANELSADMVIDGNGLSVIPGLWDMHAHTSTYDGALNIANGVTSIRDLGNKHETVIEAAELFSSGQVIGPSVYRAGFIDKKSPYSAPTGRLADTLDETLDSIEWYADRGYQQIKLYSSIEPTWVPIIAKRTHERGMKLSGHIPSFMTAEQAVKDGIDEIQHINMIFLNFLAGHQDDTRTPIRFTLVGDKAGELDIDSVQVSKFISVLKEHDTIVDPTATIFHSMFLNKAGQVDPGYKAVVNHLPTNVGRYFLRSKLDINPSNEKQYQKSADALLKMIKKLFDAEIRLVPGTDALAGFTLHRELELYEKAGIPSSEVLKIATSSAAKIASNKNSGVIKPGFQADLVFVDGNPLKNISAVRNVAFVIKGTHAYRTNDLFKSMGIKPFTNKSVAIK